jgi:hypothetical protein
MPYFGIPIRNGLPIGLGSVAGFGVAPAFSPSVLFAAGEQGAWYDPSDYGVGGTLFQDVAGTTPVTGVEQFVRLMLDKSKQQTFAARLNLLNWSEQFDNAYWTGENASVTANQAVAPDGTTTADALTDNGNNSRHIIYSQFTDSFSISRRFAVYGKQNTLRYLVLSVPLTSDVSCYSAVFDLQTGTVTDTKANGTGTVSASISSVGNGWYLCSITGIVASSSSGNFFPMIGTSDRPGFTGSLQSNNMPQYVGSGQSLYIWGADLRLTSNANTLPTYQPTTTLPTSWLGNHALAPSDPARPILRARYNLLTYSEEFDNGAWFKRSCTITQNAEVAPNGTTTADLVLEQATTDRHGPFNNVGLDPVLGVSYTYSVYAKAAGRSFLVIDAYTNTPAYTWFDLSTGQVGTNASGSTASITAVGNGWYRCSVQRVSTSSTAGQLYIGIYAAPSDNTISYAGDVTKGIYIWGADLRVTNDALNQPAYQRVGAASDYDTNGFLPYLQFDGSDDAMSTSAIDFSGTEKMTVFAGVRKLVGSGLITELSSATFSNAGAFGLSSAGWLASNPAKYGTSARGNASVNLDSETQASTFAPPISNVVTASYNIAGVTNADAISMRVNGSSTALNYNLGPLSGGNFGNHPLFIGARNNASAWFTGRIYSLIVRGAASSASEIAATESWVNGKTGAY